MLVDNLSAALQSLQSERPDQVDEGVEFLRERIGHLSEADFRSAVEGLCSLFYVDTADRPDLVPVIDRAIAVLAGQGSRVVSQLLAFMAGSDIKSHLCLGRTLGAIGPPALPALRLVLARDEDPYSRSFALFALGKVRHPSVREALPEVLGSLLHPDKEVRDSAARTLGKIGEVVPAAEIPEDLRAQIFEALWRTLSDFQPAVRAKGVRSLGKMACAGYWSCDQERHVGLALRRILGLDDAYEWDRAYIVRREAEEALRHLQTARTVDPALKEQSSHAGGGKGY